MGEPIRYPMPPALAAMPIAAHQVIEASAGTGKTYLIEHRVVDLILRGGATLDRILVVTFTEKATAELRGRVRRLLDRVHSARAHAAAADAPHWLVDDAARRRLGDALMSFDAAPIFTIHGFCHRVLVDEAFAHRRLLEQTQVATEVAFSDTFRRALRERFARAGGERAYIRAWLASGRTVDGLERQLFGCLDHRGPITPRFDPDAVAAALGDVSAALSRLGGPPDEERLRRAGVATRQARALVPRLAALAAVVSPSAEDAGDSLLVRALADLDRCDIDYVADKLGARTLAEPDLAALAAATRRLRAARCPLEAAIVHTLLPPLAAELARDKARAGTFDFGDMLALVSDSLERPGGAELARRLRHRYRFALIDEFQDTDELQWRIFRALYLPGDGASFLSIIGDPKQAIYGFRGADVATYLRARAEVLASGGVVTELADNYRSTPAVVGAQNRLFCAAGAEPFFCGGIRYDRPVTAATDLVATDARGRIGAPVTVWRLVPAGDAFAAAGLRETLRRRIVSEIEQLLSPAGGLWLHPAARPDARRRLTARDMFVLTRNRPEADELAAALRAAGVPCALFKQTGLFQTAEAREVLELLAAIAEPRNRAARVRAWQTRFFGVALADLPALSDPGDDHPLIARLYEWKALADRLAYEELFARIIRDSGVACRELFFESSERALTNILHLFELLVEETAASRCELHDLIARLGGWLDAGDDGADERSIQRLETDRDAVQIMTMHNAKGLEAGVVFLYGGFGAGRDDGRHVYHVDGERRLHLGRPTGDIAAAVAEERRGEDQRLAYVAVTRAVARLYVPFVDPADYRRLDGTQAQLGRSLRGIVAGGEGRDDGAGSRDDGAGAPGGLFAVEPVFEPKAETAAARDPDAAAEPDPDPAAALAGWRPPPRLLAPPPAAAAEDPALDPARRGFAVSSYTRLKALAQAARAPMTAADFNTDMTAAAAAAVGDDELPPGPETGLCLHEVLERVALSPVREADSAGAWGARTEVEQLLAGALSRHDLGRRYLPHTRALIFAALTTPVELGGATLPGLAWCDRDAREVEFLYPIPRRPGDGERGFIKGYIDLVFEWRGRVYLLDWKSDALADYRPASIAAHVDAHYAVQATLYSLALIKMLAIAGEADHARRFGGVLYWFLRGAGGPEGAGVGVHFARPSFAELSRAEAELADREQW